MVCASSRDAGNFRRMLRTTRAPRAFKEVSLARSEGFLLKPLLYKPSLTNIIIDWDRLLSLVYVDGYITVLAGWLVYSNPMLYSQNPTDRLSSLLSILTYLCPLTNNTSACICLFNVTLDIMKTRIFSVSIFVIDTKCMWNKHFHFKIYNQGH